MPTSKPFAVLRSRIQGRGVFATRRIRKRQVLVEYTGEHLTNKQVEQIYGHHNGRFHTFLFQLDQATTIDGSRGGSAASLINHSCDPNCEAFTDDNDRLMIRAKRHISPGVELTIDYGLRNPCTRENVRYYACHCGSSQCRGTMLDYPAYMRAKVKRWLASTNP